MKTIIILLFPILSIAQDNCDKTWFGHIGIAGGYSTTKEVNYRMELGVKKSGSLVYPSATIGFYNAPRVYYGVKTDTIQQANMEITLRGNIVPYYSPQRAFIISGEGVYDEFLGEVFIGAAVSYQELLVYGETSSLYIRFELEQTLHKMASRKRAFISLLIAF